jgi:two-component system, OmpR family, sensor histidine kinase KdpD
MRGPDFAAWYAALDEPGEPAFSRGRRFGGFWLALFGLPLLTLLLDSTDALAIEGVVLLYLALVEIIAFVGGVIIGCFSAMAAALLIDFFFIEPEHTFRFARTNEAISLILFVIVAAVTSSAVELAARQRRRAERAEADLAALRDDETS